MKSFNKRKASKVAYKNHPKNKLLPKVEERKIPENIPGIRHSDILNSNK